MNIYTNETNGFHFDSVITLTDKLASNQTTLIGAFLASFLLIGLIISIPFHIIKCLIISPLTWAWSWFSLILCAVIGSAFYLFFYALYKWAKSSKKPQLIEMKAEIIQSVMIESSPVIEVEISKIAGLLPAAKFTESGQTFQEFVTENLPILHTETVDINPIKVIEILETVDSNPESKSETFGFPSYEFIKFCTVWEYMNTLSNLFKQVKVSELKSYAKDLNIPQYRKLKKLELLIAITQ
ncbi:MAG: Rho termination factor N-terminal domain-containing protein [Lyngbya sp.]|nr:Rho termination factor N-terminal domain-containing protein [Lyngbya sp.]